MRAIKNHGRFSRAWFVVLALGVATPANFAQAPDRRILPPMRKAAPGQGAPEYLVGVHYFSGWWPEAPSRYVIKDQDWRPQYSERKPLLGDYNTQQGMDYEIRAAAGYGVDFFQFLWYPPDPNSPEAGQGGVSKFTSASQRLNDGLRFYLGSPNRHDMQFSMEYVNHPPFNISDRDWPKACEYWAKCMTEKTYMRINGRPLFKIHGLEHFFGQCGSNMSKLADRLAQLRDAAREAGAGPPLIGAGVVSGDRIPASVAEPFDWLTTYMDMPPVKPRPEPYPYTQLSDFAASCWQKSIDKYKKPYAPFIPAGWDPRPWQDKRPPFTFPTREEWRAMLDRAKAAMDGNPQLTMPTGLEKRQKLVLIYAWNEFGEGGIVAPTHGDQYMKLEVIREVFGQLPGSP